MLLKMNICEHMNVFDVKFQRRITPTMLIILLSFKDKFSLINNLEMHPCFRHGQIWFLRDIDESPTKCLQFYIGSDDRLY
jgi:hypothetical protein